jgi:hypothetical protein
MESTEQGLPSCPTLYMYFKHSTGEAVSRDSIAGIATGYELDGRGVEI